MQSKEQGRSGKGDKDVKTYFIDMMRSAVSRERPSLEMGDEWSTRQTRCTSSGRVEGSEIQKAVGGVGPGP